MNGGTMGWSPSVMIESLHMLTSRRALLIALMKGSRAPLQGVGTTKAIRSVER